LKLYVKKYHKKFEEQVKNKCPTKKEKSAKMSLTKNIFLDIKTEDNKRRVIKESYEPSRKISTSIEEIFG